MHVEKLIEALQKLPKNAVVVVGGQVIHGVELRRGRLVIGYYNPQFVLDPKGAENGIVFLRNTELSTGEVVSAPA